MEQDALGAGGGPRPWHKPPRLYEEIARDLAESITRGEFPPGEFLPTEQVLADRYGASRNVTREALKMLAARGMVESIHGRGTRVLPRYRWQVLEQLVQSLRYDRGLVDSLLELRRVLEVAVAGMAADRATPEQMQAMREVLRRHQESAAVPEEAIEHDLEFHQLLAEAAANPLLPPVMAPIAQVVRANSLVLATRRDAVERAISFHREILACIEMRDAAGARREMQRHLETNRDATWQTLSSASGLDSQTEPGPRSSDRVSLESCEDKRPGTI